MPRKALTEQGVERLRPPKSNRAEINDKTVPGLVFRVTPRGVKSWSVLYRIAGAGGMNGKGRLLKGQQRRLTLGQFPIIGLADARDRARKALKLAEQGKDPAKQRHAEIMEQREQAANTVGRVVDEFIEKYAKKNTRKWRQTKRTFEIHVLARWGDRPLGDIRRRDVIRLLDEIVAEGKPQAAAEVLKHTRKLYNWAIERDLVELNPFDRVKPPVPAVGRERELAPDEISVVWQAAEELGYPFGTLMQLLLLTGQRRTEVANMRWAWLSLEGETPQIEMPGAFYKSGRAHVVPLSTMALEIVQSLPRFKAGDYVLSTTHGRRPISGISRAKARLDKKVAQGDTSVEPWQLHDLRRTVVSGMAELEISYEIRERVVGHALPGLDRTYNKYDYLKPKYRALEAWAGRIRDILGQRDDKVVPIRGA